MLAVMAMTIGQMNINFRSKLRFWINQKYQVGLVVILTLFLSQESFAIKKLFKMALFVKCQALKRCSHLRE